MAPRRALRCLWLVFYGWLPLAHAGPLPQGYNPYQSIVERNVFHLRPPAPIQKPASPPEPLPVIILTGITTIVGNPRVFLEITPVGKPAQKTGTKSCMLTQGQREGELEVLEIDPKAGSVKVSYSGTVTNLTFEKNGRKATATAQPPRIAIPVRQFPARSVSRQG